MYRTTLRVLMAAVLAGLGTMFVLLPLAAQDNPSAIRTIDPTKVAAGGQVVVTIEASEYGSAGGVTETLPTGFTYESSSLPDSQVTELSGNRVRFTLQGDDSFTYTVTASDTPGGYEFSGTLRDFDRNDSPVGGAESVTVEGDAAGASATRSIDPTKVAAGGQVVVTIEASDYGSGWRGDGDAAHRVHLRVQRSRLQPGHRAFRQSSQVHAARG